MANEVRLIDANALSIRVMDASYWDNQDEDVIWNLVQDAPTIDAVEVVRCKDCKHWLHMEDGFGDCTNGRFHLDGHPDPTMKADDFCSCGEKREV